MRASTLLPTGVVTFLFTDIEGSTRLWEAFPELMQTVVARHDALLRQAVAENGGVVFKTTGDGLVAAFAEADDGVRAAIAGQRALLTESWPAETIIRARMGLHTGAAEQRDGDYYGQVLNRAARLMAAGHGGQTLVAGVTQELCRDCLPPQVSLVSLGDHRLKDLTRSESVFQVNHPELPDAFPPLKSLDNPILPNNLPQQVNRFIGREAQMDDVKRLLSGKSGTRLLTLVGAGGTGKTRLSLQVAADLLDPERFSEGAWLVELAALADPNLVPQTVAQTLGIPEQSGQPLLQTLAAALKPRRLLLLLDNCEHLIAACASLAATVLRECPGVTILATSRERLNVGGEQVYRIPSLSLPAAAKRTPETPESIAPFEAVRLFFDRALLVRSDFEITDANAGALAQICRRLDGIPLAIELAAARTRSLSVEQINERLDNRFRLLTGGSRSELPRQQTLRALIDWSYDLLSEAEKALLARLSAFAGGWTLEAAEAVCGFAGIEDWEVLDLLTGLADKSLVQTEQIDASGSREASMRYAMLETVRQYAQEKLHDSGEADDVRERQAGWCLVFAEDANPKLSGAQQGLWLNRFEAEHDNLRTALNWCAVRVLQSETVSAEFPLILGLRLVHKLSYFWLVRGYLGEGREQATRILAARAGIGPAAEKEEVKEAASGALLAAGALAWNQGEFAISRQFYDESLELVRDGGNKDAAATTLMGLGNLAVSRADFVAAGPLYEQCLALRQETENKSGVAACLVNLGIVAGRLGDRATARMRFEEALAVAREIGDKRNVAIALNNLGSSALNRGDVAAARTYWEESLSLRQELGDRRGIADISMNLCTVALRDDDLATARERVTEGLLLFRDVGDRRGMAHGLENMARVCLATGNASQAAALFSAASSLRDAIGARLPQSEQARLDESLEEARAALGEDRFAASWNEGSVWSEETAIARALEDLRN